MTTQIIHAKPLTREEILAKLKGRFFTLDGNPFPNEELAAALALAAADEDTDCYFSLDTILDLAIHEETSGGGGALPIVTLKRVSGFVKVHYEIDHYPNLETQLFVCYADQSERQLLTRKYSLAEALEYVDTSYRARGHGARPEITRREENGSIFYATQEIEIGR